MVTTIQLSKEVKSELDELKFNGETYEDVIRDLIEDRYILNNETLREIELARKEYKQGKFISHEDLKTKLNL